ncbi:hypothetical protein BC828DRAFT_379512 [Blastocladiella britannica]|nr:hypothetical protein BC828DRAFT_379512 [Blastocladiella britannica]
MAAVVTAGVVGVGAPTLWVAIVGATNELMATAGAATAATRATLVPLEKVAATTAMAATTRTAATTAMTAMTVVYVGTPIVAALTTAAPTGGATKARAMEVRATKATARAMSSGARTAKVNAMTVTATAEPPLSTSSWKHSRRQILPRSRQCVDRAC